MQYSAGSVSMTLNSTVRIPPRTKNVSPLRTGRYAGDMSEWSSDNRSCNTRTLEEVWLEVDVENVTAQAFNGIVEGENMYPLSVLDVQTCMHVHHVAKLDAKVVARDLVHLNLAFLDIVGA